MELRRAIFQKYNGDWEEMERDFDVLSRTYGTPSEDFSLYMKGLNDSLSVEARVGVCHFLGLDPDDYRELAYRRKT